MNRKKALILECVIIGMVCVLGASFSWSQLMSNDQPAANFFSFYARAHELSGYAVTRVGKLGANNYPDFAIGEPGDISFSFTPGFTPDAGGRVVVRDGESKDVWFTWQIQGKVKERFGSALADLPDLNQDNKPDLLVGIPNGNLPAGGYAGTGSAELFSLVPFLGTSYYTLLGAQIGDGFGYAVARVGDVNGDGTEDIAVGAPYAFISSSTSGRLEVYSGAAIKQNLPQSQALLARIDSPGPQLFAVNTVGAGDINGDGFADLLVGAPYAHKAYVYYGATNGLNPTPTELRGSHFFGESAVSLGDLNGDGFSDLVIGNPNGDKLGSAACLPRGTVSVFRGSAAGIETTPVVTLVGNSGEEIFGLALADAGDVNGDGHRELVIGAPAGTGCGSGVMAGNAYVYDISTLAQPRLIAQYHGVNANDRFGFAVAGVGDINQDGFDDLISGAPLYDYNPTNPGFQDETGIAYGFELIAGGALAYGQGGGSGQPVFLSWKHTTGTAGTVTFDGGATRANQTIELMLAGAALKFGDRYLPGHAPLLVDLTNKGRVLPLKLDGSGKATVAIDLAKLGFLPGTNIYMQLAAKTGSQFSTSEGLQLRTF